MGEAVYAIDDFPDDELLWRIEWIGGVGYNTSVPSDPLILPGIKATLDGHHGSRYARSNEPNDSCWASANASVASDSAGILYSRK